MKNVIISTSRMVKSIMLLAMLLLTYSAWGQQNWLPNHPRLLFTGAETSEVKELIKNEPLAGELALYLKAEADSIAEAPQLPYEMDKYGNMLWTSRAYVYRLGTLSLAYRIYGEDKYLKAANDAILWVCNFPDWDPKHYLDTAEMTTAVAIAYDWLFAELPQATKQLVKASIYKNAIHRVLREYEKGGPGSWAKRETNWNVVCNTGMVLGALAVAEEIDQYDLAFHSHRGKIAFLFISPIVLVACQYRAFRSNQCHAVLNQFQQLQLFFLFCPIIPHSLLQRLAERFARHPSECFHPFSRLIGICQPFVRPDFLRGSIGIPVSPVFQFFYGKVITKCLSNIVQSVVSDK